MDGAGFLFPAPDSEGARRLFDEDVAGDGYVMNLTRVWAHQPADERALAAWARQVVEDPSGTTAADVQPLRDAGFDDSQVVAVTAYVAGRLAFSTVNDALGALPDAELRSSVDPQVRAAVTWGRPVADA